MDERRWLQSVAVALFPQVTGRELTKLPVYERGEVIEGLLVTLRPVGQKSRHFMRDRTTHMLMVLTLNSDGIIHVCAPPLLNFTWRCFLKREVSRVIDFRTGLRMIR
jgi:hypothetical protein